MKLFSKIPLTGHTDLAIRCVLGDELRTKRLALRAAKKDCEIF